MSNKQLLKDAVKTLKQAKQETTDEVTKAAADVELTRQVRTEQPDRQS